MSPLEFSEWVLAGAASLAAVGTLYTKLFKPMARIVVIAETLGPHVDTIVNQLKPNGGNSLADRVNALDSKLTHSLRDGQAFRESTEHNIRNMRQVLNEIYRGLNHRAEPHIPQQTHYESQYLPFIERGPREE